MSIATSRLRKRDDGTEETVTHLLDFVELPHSHSGENMAEALRKVLVDYGIEHKVSPQIELKNIIDHVPKKIISITCDNASANTVMVGKLSELLPAFPGLAAHVRCFAHTINLTAKGVLRPFETKRIKNQVDEGSELEAISKDTEIEELQAELKDLEDNGEQAKDDLEGFVDVLNEMTEEERMEWNDGVKPIRGALIKVRMPLHTIGLYQFLAQTN